MHSVKNSYSFQYHDEPAKEQEAAGIGVSELGNIDILAFPRVCSCVDDARCALLLAVYTRISFLDYWQILLAIATAVDVHVADVRSGR